MSFQTLEAVATGHRVVRVDLLPPEFELARKGQTVKLALGAGLIAVLGACAGGYLITAGHVADAESALSAEQARTPGLQSAQKPYAEVPVVTTQLQQLQEVKSHVTAGDVQLYRYVDAVAGNVPTGTALTSLVFQVEGASKTQSSNGAQTSDPLAVQGIGTVSVNGTTRDQVTVADWLTNLGTVKGLTDARLSNSTTDDDGVISFTSTATMTSDALTNGQ